MNQYKTYCPICKFENLYPYEMNYEYGNKHLSLLDTLFRYKPMRECLSLNVVCVNCGTEYKAELKNNTTDNILDKYLEELKRKDGVKDGC